MAFATHAYGFGKLVHNLLPPNARQSKETLGLREDHHKGASPSCYQEFYFYFFAYSFLVLIPSTSAS